jgi:dipeptide/tripeptide permease
VLKSGEKVIVDPETTVQRTMLIFYGMVNVGAFYSVATTYAERYVGYWLAYLLAGIIYFLLPIVLVLIYKGTKKYPPAGSELTKAIKIISVALRRSRFRFWRKDFWDAAKPSTLAAQGASNIKVDWDDKLVEDVKRTIDSCGVFLYFPIWNLNDGGIGSVASNQGAAMNTNGAPNDLLSNFNPLTIIVTIPLLSHVIYPLLNRYKIKFGRISRITFGFSLAMISGVVGGIVQYYVYKTSPCGYYASTCETGVSPLSVWLQIPNFSLGAISECFCNVTAYELAYARSPKSMKGLVMAIFLFMTALSSALGEILIPATVDPYLIWIWIGPAIALFIQTIIFWFRYRHLNDEAFMTYEEDFPKEEEVQPIDKGEKEV